MTWPPSVTSLIRASNFLSSPSLSACWYLRAILANSSLNKASLAVSLVIFQMHGDFNFIPLRCEDFFRKISDQIPADVLLLCENLELDLTLVRDCWISFDEIHDSPRVIISQNVKRSNNISVILYL